MAASAQAIVTEPDGRLVPQPLTEDVTPGVVSCCGVAADGSNMSLEALFASRGEAIHWQNDASVEPQYFSPLCGFRGSLILRGGGCRIDFGWYNVDLNNPAPPAQIIPLVTTADVANWFTENGYPPNNANAFHPAVGEPPIEGVPIEDIRSHPSYLGGFIGLATVGNDLDGVCTQTHYSEPRLNQASIYDGQPWIMSVVYRSTVTPNAFYLGFEDLPTDPDNFQKPVPDLGYMNDGDFNDFVYIVEGVTCEGGGQPCLASGEGACGYGLMECQPDGSVVCVAQLQSSDEVCDNIDNDCNGLVDDGELCGEYEVCDKGVCRGNCSGGEFDCIGGLVCDNDTGLCVDPLCLEMEVPCAAGQVCIGGECVGGCEGAVCPWGQVCQLGRCVDPCRDRVCPGTDQVCEGGICVERCECRPCGAGMECNLVSGACEPTQCAGVTCPPNEVCLAGGVCQNRCNNVLCPGGADCDPATGECNPPLGEPPQMVDYTLRMLPDGGLAREWHDGRPSDAVALLPDGGLESLGPIDPDAGTEPPPDDGGDLSSGEAGCGCRTSGGSGSAAWIGGLALLAAAIRRNRRRFRRRSGLG